MISPACAHSPFDIAFFARGREGDVLLVSRPQLCLPRKLVGTRAKIGQSLLFRYLPTVSCYTYLSLLSVAVNIFNSVFFGADSMSEGSLVDVNENFPLQPDTGRPAVTVSTSLASGRLDAKKLKAVLRVSEVGPSGSLPPHVVYLLELGFDLEQIKVIAYKFPNFSYYTLERKIRPLIEFLLDLGVSKLDLPKILIRHPGLCGLSLSENIIPTMAFLETLGVDKTKWAKVITRSPKVLTYSRTKIDTNVEFLYEMGLSRQSIGKILNLWPQILAFSVEGNLQPSAEYFRSLGVDVAIVLRICPSIIGLSIEDNLKPSTEFFLENGFTIEEVGTMISRFGYLYAYSLKGNIVPKWEFFLTMDYTRQDLIKYPQYFGFSLKDRIKPRFSLMKESGVKFSLNQLLSIKREKFELLLKKKIEKLQFEE